VIYDCILTFNGIDTSYIIILKVILGIHKTRAPIEYKHKSTADLARFQQTAACNNNNNNNR